MTDVLSVASEIYPLIKTGGLADVAGALPAALSDHGVHMRTLVPGYRQVLDRIERGAVLAHFDDLFGGAARLIAGASDGLDLIVIEADHLYDRPGGPYSGPDGVDWPDNWRRFAALSWVAAEIARGLLDGYSPRIVHAHDWQAAMSAAYIAFGPPSDVKTVVTIHNLAFQGQFGADIFGQLRLPAGAFTMTGVEYYGGVGFLKGGLQCAHALTTVSPTYALEIRTPEFGMGLDGLLRARTDDLHGILNGIDTRAWDPSIDGALAKTFRADALKWRGENKTALLERFHLDDGEGPLFGIVSRLTWQKGIDLLAGAVDDLVAMGGRLCVLGTGEADLEQGLLAAQERHRGKVGVILGYDEGLSHLVQGGADAILIPSRFEPCGLTQLYGLRYGCVPVVAHTGGLADTVIDANEAAVAAGVATGVQFSPITGPALSDALRRTVKLYHDQKVWRRLQRCGMKSDVSWDASASRYADLYRGLLGGND
ncbi:MAG TPA: glycogen synthase GlgA [Devosiaceae bacterium]